MTETEQKPSLAPGFIVTVFGTDLDLSEATDVKAFIKRPDESLIERDAIPFAPQRIELALHPDDLSLSGRYLGEVRLNLGGEEHVFSPAFELLYAARPSDT